MLGATTSLNGVPPAILLARDRAAPRSFQADLAVYFVVSNTIALALLAARGAFATHALIAGGLGWLPGALLGNLLGNIAGVRLPEQGFRYLTYAVVFIAGIITTATA